MVQQAGRAVKLDALFRCLTEKDCRYLVAGRGLSDDALQLRLHKAVRLLRHQLHDVAEQGEELRPSRQLCHLRTRHAMRQGHRPCMYRMKSSVRLERCATYMDQTCFQTLSAHLSKAVRNQAGDWTGACVLGAPHEAVL